MSSASKKKQRRRRRPRSPAEQPSDPPVGSGREAEQPTGSYSEQPTGRYSKGIESERPPAPWDPFPLVELLVLAGLAMIVVGLVIGLNEPRGQTALIAGLALASLGGLELSIREHFGGFRSHTTLLASAVAVGVLAALYYAADVSGLTSLIVAAAVGIGAAAFLVGVFRARSGGRSVKLR